MDRDDAEICDIGAVDEKSAGDLVMEIGRRTVSRASAHEFAHLERKARVHVSARRLDLNADLPRERA